ncbi:MAG TPA: GxxExxY protein [Anaerolineae bacterium]|nr:GxxExxY protein [Anaerolineae bacterium]
MNNKHLHESLTYKIRGIIFNVRKALGPALPEAIYQKAMSIGLDHANIPHQLEKRFDVYYQGVNVGWYFVDIWVDGGKVLIELKSQPDLTNMHQAQILSYLKITNADLGLLVNFGQARAQIERYIPFSKQPEPFRPQSKQYEGRQHSPLIDKIMGVLYRVHYELGPGYLHQVYRRATRVELRKQEIHHRYIKQIPITYLGQHITNQDVRLISVKDTILVATIAVNQILPEMKEQLRARIRLLKHDLAILANFNGTKLQVELIGTADRRKH